MTFDETIAAYHERMDVLRAAFRRQGCLYAHSQRDPGYAIFLHRGTETAFEVHSFRDGQPIGHRDYDRLEGGGPIQNAFQEFASTDFVLEERGLRRPVAAVVMPSASP